MYWLSWIILVHRRYILLVPPDLPESRRVSELESHDMPGNVSDCRYSFIKWLAHFVFISKQQDKAIEKYSVLYINLAVILWWSNDYQIQVHCLIFIFHMLHVDSDAVIVSLALVYLYEHSIFLCVVMHCLVLLNSQVPETVGSEEDITESDQPMAAVAENMPGSNTSTLSTGSHHSELESLTSSLCYEEWGNENEIVRTVLFSTRENINIIHESFRQVHHQHRHSLLVLISINIWHRVSKHCWETVCVQVIKWC